MAKGIELEGIVTSALKGANFIVTVPQGSQELKVHAHLSGRMRQNNIYVIEGDKVLVEVSPYELTKGRITRRLRTNDKPRDDT